MGVTNEVQVPGGFAVRGISPGTQGLGGRVQSTDRHCGEETSRYQSPESDWNPGPPTVNDANSTHSTAKFGRFK